MEKESLTRAEIMQKLYLTNKDIQVLCGCSANKAVEIKKAVMNYCDSFGGIFKTRIATADFNAWMKANRQKSRRKGEENC